MTAEIRQISAQAKKSRGISIAIIASDLGDGGGVNRAIRDLAVIFASMPGVETTIIARGGQTPFYPFPAEARIEIHPRTFSGWRRWRLYRDLRSRGFDFLIGMWFDENIRLPIAFLGSKSRVIVAEHISWWIPPIKTRAIRNLTYRLADAVVALNPVERDHYGRFLKRVALVPNPVASFDGCLAPKEKLVLCVGHLTELKNFADSILAFSISGIEQLGWKMAVIGDGPQRFELERLAGSLAVQSLQFVPETRTIAEWYSRAALLLCTSKVEVFSLAVAEATSFGIVPLAYDLDGPSYILEDFPELLVRWGDVAALSQRLKWLASEDRLPAYAERVRSIVADRFSFDEVAPMWRALISQ
jgi:glycosyltransferase involved in cell wall biosynthesis